MGLYGNIVVEPADTDYWPPAHREVVLTLDDILIEDGHVAAAFSHSGPSHVAMGRFGTTMLVGGETALASRRSKARSSASSSRTRPTPGCSGSVFAGAR